MALVITATPGSATANSYLTLAEANEYCEAHIAGAAWAAKTDDEKNRALAHATRQLDAHLRWVGWVASQTQALAWPRLGVSDPITGAYISSAVVPLAVKRACAEQARLLLASGDRSIESDAERDNIKRLAAGSVEVEYGSGPSTEPATAIAPSAMAFISEWAIETGAGGARTVALVRG
jgi:hypothetical protein